eukprot:218242-Rhodomonas_salina.2
MPVASPVGALDQREGLRGVSNLNLRLPQSRLPMCGVPETGLRIKETARRHGHIYASATSRPAPERDNHCQPRLTDPQIGTHSHADSGSILPPRLPPSHGRSRKFNSSSSCHHRPRRVAHLLTRVKQILAGFIV